MTFRRKVKLRKAGSLAAASLFLAQVTATSAGAYTLGSTVGDMRQPASLSGGTSCPHVTRFDVSTPGTINRQWSISLGTNPVTILTANQTPSGQLNEIEQVVQESFAVWTGVSGTLLNPTSLGTLQRTSVQNACTPSDGLNTICLNQSDPAFTAGVLAFTRVITADVIGKQLSAATPPSTFVGEILDADVQLRPGDTNVKFATPAALASNPGAYDLESILTHELGHMFGFNHSAMWNAMMFPFAPPPGQFTGIRPTPQFPDAPLSDDDRTGLRVLYPDPADTLHVGTVSGRILPANPQVLPVSPPGVTGIYPAQVVAIDDASGAVIASTLAGWSCSDPGPVQFDGSYTFGRLTVGPSQTYQIYVEPLDGPVTPAQLVNGPTPVCRNSATDPGWPAQYACTVPPVTVPFSTRIRPAS
jgi:Matrixin